jgi:sigma-E factor negative regulatory protein RseB
MQSSSADQRRGLARWASTTALWCALAAGAQAQGAAGPETSRQQGLDARQALQWLTRMHDAARHANYQGTLVVSRDGQLLSSRVAYFCDGKQSFERVDVLDGQPRQVLRHNSQVLTVWPTERAATLEQRPQQMAGAGPQSVESRLLGSYEVFDEGRGRVAGHETHVLLLRPRDPWRFAQRLWLDQGSGLVLRSDVMSLEGRVLESTAFSDVSLSVKPQPEMVSVPMKRLEGLRVVRQESAPTDLAAEGWRLKVPVPGFKALSCVRRMWSTEAAAQPVIQAIYSDGLTHVSLFVEPRSDRTRRSGVMATGATHTLMTTVHAHELTVIGDVPPSTLKEFAKALERIR